MPAVATSHGGGLLAIGFSDRVTRPTRYELERARQLTVADDRTVSPVTLALAAVATDAVHLLTVPNATQLRACQAPGCVLYFVKSHPHREWCSEACGNRVRAARHYQRSRKK